MVKKKAQKQSTKSQVKRYLIPLIFLIIMLPIMVAAVVFGFSDVLLPRADSPPTVRLWVTPSTAIVKEGQSVTLKVMAAVEPKTVIIPSLSFSLVSDPALTLSSNSVMYNKPLQGQSLMGEISITAVEKGKYTVGISENSVRVAGNFNPTVSSVGATIISQ